jgi:mannose-6-phosphate isomerase-like protein (cupin superfamily)
MEDWSGTLFDGPESRREGETTVTLFRCCLFVPATVFCCVAIAQQANPGGRGGAQSNSQSNEAAGVDVERFIGVATDSPVHLSQGLLLTHSMLKVGDPYHPGVRGAVLEYRKDLSVATLLPKNRTPMVEAPDQLFFYVESGEGRLDDGKQFWDLRENIAVLIPPNAAHRLVNDSDKPLTIVMLTWTASAPPRQDILVRDVNLLPWCEENVHWNNTSKCVFGAADGLYQSERMYLVMLQPWAASQPHSHGQGTEEIWTKVTPGTATILIGSELREMPQNSAYLVPPTGSTEHSNFNLSTDRVDWYLYVAHGPISPPGAPTNAAQDGGRGGRGGANNNPNVVRDRASVERATVAGKPIR